jgi:hypothetical protein
MVFPFFSLFIFLKVWFLTLETCVVYFWGCFCVTCCLFLGLFLCNVFLHKLCSCFLLFKVSVGFNTHKQSFYISLAERFLLWLARYQFCAFCKKTLLPFTIPLQPSLTHTGSSFKFFVFPTTNPIFWIHVLCVSTCSYEHLCFSRVHLQKSEGYEIEMGYKKGLISLNLTAALCY